MAQMFDNKDAEVTILEQGEIFIYVDSYTTDTGAKVVDATVPTGKKWVLKMIQSDLSGQPTYHYINVLKGADDIRLTANATDKLILWQPTVNLTLTDGESIRIKYSTAVSTTYTLRLLVQEMDA